MIYDFPKIKRKQHLQLVKIIHIFIAILHCFFAREFSEGVGGESWQQVRKKGVDLGHRLKKVISESWVHLRRGARQQSAPLHELLQSVTPRDWVGGPRGAVKDANLLRPENISRSLEQQLLFGNTIPIVSDIGGGDEDSVGQQVDGHEISYLVLARLRSANGSPKNAKDNAIDAAVVVHPAGKRLLQCRCH